MFLVHDYMRYIITMNMNEKIFSFAPITNVSIAKIKLSFKFKKALKFNSLFYINILILHKLFDWRSNQSRVNWIKLKQKMAFQLQKDNIFGCSMELKDMQVSVFIINFLWLSGSGNYCAEEQLFYVNKQNSDSNIIHTWIDKSFIGHGLRNEYKMLRDCYDDIKHGLKIEYVFSSNSFLYNKLLISHYGLLIW